MDHIRVFVSSSMAELGPERAAVGRALQRLGIVAWLFEEDAGTRSTTTQQTYLNELDKSDRYIGIFWKRLGKYTLDEFKHAKDHLKIDRLIDERRCEDGERDKELDAFLNEVSGVETGITKRRPFVNVDELEHWIQQDVDHWRTSRVCKTRNRGTDSVFLAPAPGGYHVKRSVQERLVSLALKSDHPSVSRIALHGAPGMGKSTLAAAFAYDDRVQRVFSDGVLWVTLGQRPDVLAGLSAWGKALADPELPDQGYPTIESAVARLRSCLHDRAYLLIVDDAWSPGDVDPAFLIGGPKCLLLVTTRQERVATRIEAQTVVVESMLPTEALELLSHWAGAIAPNDQATALRLAEEVGFLPLALGVIGARVKSIGSWREYAARWEERGVEALTRDRGATGKRDNVRDSLELSLTSLTAEDRARYCQLGAFSRQVGFPASAAAAL